MDNFLNTTRWSQWISGVGHILGRLRLHVGIVESFL